MPRLVVAGAGMAGLAAAAHARERGADVLLLEKGDRPGGSMALSSGMVWRYREFERFREECPAGDPALQRLVFDRLDGDIAWLESLGGPLVGRDPGTPLTTGGRFAARGIAGVLTRDADVRLWQPLAQLPDGVPTILATGGFQADRELVREHITPEADSVMLRAAPWSTGAGLRRGLAAGGSRSEGLEQFYGRNMPAPPARVDESGFVPLVQLYGRHATVTNARGERFEPRAWSEIDVVQWTARQPGARAWYRVERDALDERVRDRTVGDMIEAARTAGANVEDDGSALVVEPAAAITTTLGGLRIDERARVAPGVYACGADAGGIATGGSRRGPAPRPGLGGT